MKTRGQIALALALLVLPASAGNAQQQNLNFLSLEQMVNEGSSESTLALRCAGLFHSVWDYIGETALGPKATLQAKSNVSLFLEAGTKLRIAETGEAETDASKAAVAAAFAASGKYYTHYKNNVAAGRDAYASDEMWSSDLEICKNLAEQL